MTVTLSCALATSMATPEHVVLAEQLGYRRAWLYDSPALYPEVWMTLARCAERTATIGLGPGVLIPSLRHPMTVAASIATLVELTGPGRVAVAVGSGFTGRFTLGKRPLAWAQVSEYVAVVRALLRGETTDWDGARIRMLHPDGFGAPRPIEVPFLLAAAGPKGVAAAREVGDGIYVAGAPVAGFDWEACLLAGTVLADGEDITSDRVMAAAGHIVPVGYHYMLENHGSVAMFPNGDEWLAAYDDVALDERHLALHDLHLIGINERDRPFVTADAIVASGGAFSAAQLRERLAELEAGGVTEIAYQPAGPDIPRELEAFATAHTG